MTLKKLGLRNRCEKNGTPRGEDAFERAQFWFLERARSNLSISFLPQKMQNKTFPLFQALSKFFRNPQVKDCPLKLSSTWSQACFSHSWRRSMFLHKETGDEAQSRLELMVSIIRKMCTKGSHLVGHQSTYRTSMYDEWNALFINVLIISKSMIFSLPQNKGDPQEEHFEIKIPNWSSAGTSPRQCWRRTRKILLCRGVLLSYTRRKLQSYPRNKN